MNGEVVQILATGDETLFCCGQHRHQVIGNATFPRELVMDKDEQPRNGVR